MLHHKMTNNIMMATFVVSQAVADNLLVGSD